jgi:hypothetical protein
MIVTDEDVWKAYPWARYTYFNKLWLSNHFGYNCGPAGVEIPKTGEYVVRPIYNLDGMSRGAYCASLQKGYNSFPAGYFWCEKFEGNHYSIDFEKTETGWNQILSVIGYKSSFKKFYRWVRSSSDKIIPDFLCHLNVPHVNVEYIGDKIIEVHFRQNPDFIGHNFNILDVLWNSDLPKSYDRSWTWISAREETDDDIRLGFYGR